MTDQAQGLREFVLSLDDDGTTHAELTKGHLVDCRKLWMDLKEDCQKLAETSRPSGGLVELRADDSVFSDTLLERMEQAEAFASHLAPADEDTFARVRNAINRRAQNV